MQNRFSEHKTERDREMDEMTQSLTLHVENLQVSIVAGVSVVC